MTVAYADLPSRTRACVRAVLRDDGHGFSQETVQQVVDASGIRLVTEGGWQGEARIVYCDQATDFQKLALWAADDRERRALHQIFRAPDGSDMGWVTPMNADTARLFERMVKKGILRKHKNDYAVYRFPTRAFSTAKNP